MVLNMCKICDLCCNILDATPHYDYMARQRYKPASYLSLCMCDHFNEVSFLTIN